MMRRYAFEQCRTLIAFQSSRTRTRAAYEKFESVLFETGKEHFGAFKFGAAVTKERHTKDFEERQKAVKVVAAKLTALRERPHMKEASKQAIAAAVMDAIGSVHVEEDQQAEGAWERLQKRGQKWCRDEHEYLKKEAKEDKRIAKLRAISIAFKYNRHKRMRREMITEDKTTFEAKIEDTVEMFKTIHEPPEGHVEQPDAEWRQRPSPGYHSQEADEALLSSSARPVQASQRERHQLLYGEPERCDGAQAPHAEVQDEQTASSQGCVPLRIWRQVHEGHAVLHLPYQVAANRKDRRWYVRRERKQVRETVRGRRGGGRQVEPLVDDRKRKS